MAAPLAPRADQAAGPGLGAERLRDPHRRLPALPGQAGPLRRRRPAADRGDDAGARRHRRPRQLVDAADRLPEGGRLDDALGGARPRRRLAAADPALLADDRRLPLLAAAGDDATAALAGEGAADPRDHPHLVRRGALRRADRDRGLPPGLLGQRRRRRHGRPPRPGRGRGAAGGAGRARAARQGAVPGRPGGDLRQPDDHLPVPARQPRRRRADRLRLHLVGRRLLEAEPPLPLRGHGDDQQHALEPLTQGEAAALHRPPGEPAALGDRPAVGAHGHGHRVHAAAPAAGLQRRRSSARSRSPG